MVLKLKWGYLQVVTWANQAGVEYLLVANLTQQPLAGRRGLFASGQLLDSAQCAFRNVVARVLMLLGVS